MSSPGTLAFCGRLLRRQLVLAARQPAVVFRHGSGPVPTGAWPGSG